MPTFHVPNTFGSQFRDLDEYNHCHNPSGAGGGKFCSDDRAIYGASTDDPKTLTPRLTEVTELHDLLSTSDSPGELKNEVAGALDSAWDGIETQFTALHRELESSINSHMEAIGANGHTSDNSDGETDYSGHEDEYDDWKNGEIETIDEQHYSTLQEEWATEKANYIENVRERAAEIEIVWKQEEEKLTAERREKYGEMDPNENPVLSDVTGDGTVFFPKYAKDHQNDAEEIDAKLIIDKWEVDPARHTITTEEGSKGEDDTDVEIREFIRDQILQGKRLGELTDERAVTGHEYFNEDDDEYGGFDKWRENDEGSQPDYDNIDDYETWASDQGYGVSTGGDDDEDGGGNGEMYGRQKGTASYLIHKWADTSGDSDKVAIAMQITAAKKFGLEGAYMERMRETSHVYDTAKEFAAQHDVALTAFLDKMYKNTQDHLADTPGEYVSLFRGMTLKSEGGTSSVDFEKGSLVDVNLQPMSSFSTKYATAQGFAGHGTYRASHSSVIAIRVRKSDIVGSYRSGFGAANEYEVIVLGGRRPAVIMAGATSYPDMQQVLRRNEAAQQPKAVQDPTPFPGEAY